MHVPWNDYACTLQVNMHVPFAFCTKDQVINLNAHAF